MIKFPPTNPRNLKEWARVMGGKYNIDLLLELNFWSTRNKIPGKMKDWDQDTVQRALQAMTEILVRM